MLKERSLPWNCWSHLQSWDRCQLLARIVKLQCKLHRAWKKISSLKQSLKSKGVVTISEAKSRQVIVIAPQLSKDQTLTKTCQASKTSRVQETLRGGDYLSEVVCDMFDIGHSISYSTCRNMVRILYPNLDLLATTFWNKLRWIPCRNLQDGFIQVLEVCRSSLCILWSIDLQDRLHREHGDQRIALCNFFSFLSLSSLVSSGDLFVAFGHAWYNAMKSLLALFLSFFLGMNVFIILNNQMVIP